MSLLTGIEASQSALTAEKIRLDIISQNLANSQTTRTETGEAYRRKEVVFESSIDSHIRQNNSQNIASELRKVQVSSIKEDTTPLPKVHMPSHPHADEKGMLTLPNVNILEEMVDLMSASRSFEANLQAVRASRQMFSQSLRIVAS